MDLCGKFYMPLIYRLQLVYLYLRATLTYWSVLSEMRHAQFHYKLPLSNLHWLQIHKRINFKVVTQPTRFSSLNNLLTFITIISYHQPSRSLRSSSRPISG